MQCHALQQCYREYNEQQGDRHRGGHTATDVGGCERGNDRVARRATAVFLPSSPWLLLLLMMLHADSMHHKSNIFRLQGPRLAALFEKQAKRSGVICFFCVRCVDVCGCDERCVEYTFEGYWVQRTGHNTET